MKKGDKILNTCWQCYNDIMVVYKVESKGAMVWCKCPECEAVDDLIFEITRPVAQV